MTYKKMILKISRDDLKNNRFENAENTVSKTDEVVDIYDDSFLMGLIDKYIGKMKKGAVYAGS